MAVPAAKVKAICTSAEAALVRASRTPALSQLSPGELKRYAVRARKLFDKWQNLSRDQSRDRRRQTGSSAVDPNTQLKAQIFRDALDSFEAQLAKANQASPRSGKATRAKATKKVRSTEHRANRAAVRKAVTAVKKSLNAQSAKQQSKAAAPANQAEPSAPATTKAPKPATKPAVAKKAGARSAKKSPPPAKGRASTSSMTVSQQREAITAAKKSRLARSGQSTRMLGHTIARGKRAQARRDAKN